MYYNAALWICGHIFASSPLRPTFPTEVEHSLLKAPFRFGKVKFSFWKIRKF